MFFCMISMHKQICLIAVCVSAMCSFIVCCEICFKCYIYLNVGVLFKCGGTIDMSIEHSQIHLTIYCNHDSLKNRSEQISSVIFQRYFSSKMAKTRSKRSTNWSSSSGFTPGFKNKQLKQKSSEQQSKRKLQSQEERKELDLKATAKLLKLCRPFSICLTRLKETSNAKSKSCDDFGCIYFIKFIKNIKFLFSFMHAKRNACSLPWTNCT